MSQINYRTINVDQLDPESSANFPMETLLPATLPQPETSSDAANVASQVRQLLRGGDAEAALRHVLDTAPLGGDDRAKEVHMATVIEVLQGIRQGEMSRVLEGVCGAEGGAERADCLMKYMYVALGNNSIGLCWSILERALMYFLQLQGNVLDRSKQRSSVTAQVGLAAEHGFLADSGSELGRGWWWSADECVAQLAREAG